MSKQKNTGKLQPPFRKLADGRDTMNEQDAFLPEELRDAPERGDGALPKKTGEERIRARVQESFGLDDEDFRRFLDRDELNEVSEKVGSERMKKAYATLKPEEREWLGAQWGE